MSLDTAQFLVNASEAVTAVAAQGCRARRAQAMRSKMRRGAKEVPFLGGRVFAVSRRSSG